jgi:entericidin B
MLIVAIQRYGWVRACRALRRGVRASRQSGDQNGREGMSTTLKLVIGSMALLVLPSLSACNTARGMGEDVSAAGRAMSGTAEKTEEKIQGESDKPKTGTTQ